MQFTSKCILIAFVTVCSGCGLLASDEEESSPTERGVVLLTDKLLYDSESTTEVDLIIINRTDQPLYYICAGTIFLEELDGSRVVNTWQINGFEECGRWGDIGPGVTQWALPFPFPTPSFLAGFRVPPSTQQFNIE